MKKSKISQDMAEHLIKSVLQDCLPIQNGKDRWIKVSILRTGLIARTKKGRITYPYPIGITQKWLIDFVEGKQSPYTEIRFTAKNITDLLRLAEFDPCAKDAIHKLYDILLEQGDTPPTPILHFLNRSLKSKSPQHKRGPCKTELVYRNLSIIECLMTLETFGYFPMTKSSGELGDNSACHLISNSLIEMNINIGYEGVKKIRYENLVGQK